jgi:thymidine phosphorylase
MTNGSGLVGFLHGGMGSSGGVARVSLLSKCEWTAAITSGRGYSCCVGTGDFMEGPSGSALAEEAAFHFE